ncbi:MAG: YfiR family protein [Nitrospirota bacterium]|nr:MAG: YfiR family protein [Nitrospirota bacterium]
MHTLNPRFFFLLLMALFSLIWNPDTSRSEALDEYHVKATFLYHFSYFVDWPESTFKATNGHLQICVLGKDPFGQSLDAALANKSVREHPFEIRRNPPTTELQHCHLLFLPASVSSRIRAIRHQVGKENVLTVGETFDFMMQGGMIHLFVDNEKMQFAVNTDVVNQTNLKISSKLLRLAKIYTP